MSLEVPQGITREQFHTGMEENPGIELSPKPIKRISQKTRDTS